MNLLRVVLPSMALLCGSAATGRAYRALGNEPIWEATISASHIRFHNIDFRLETFRTPARRPIRNGYVYVTPRYRFEITHGRCDEVENGRYYPDHVRVVSLDRGYVYLGCGGPVLLPPDLSYTSWRVRAVNRARLPGVDAPVVNFDNGTLEVRSACRLLAGPFSGSRRSIRPGAIVARQPEGCLDPPMPHEAELMRLFGGPISFRYPVDGNSLELSGSGIIVSLERM